MMLADFMGEAANLFLDERSVLLVEILQFAQRVNVNLLRPAQGGCYRLPGEETLFPRRRDRIQAIAIDTNNDETQPLLCGAVQVEADVMTDLENVGQRDAFDLLAQMKSSSFLP